VLDVEVLCVVDQIFQSLSELQLVLATSSANVALGLSGQLEFSCSGVAHGFLLFVADGAFPFYGPDTSDICKPG
jgi:hypothetical protein